MTTYPFSAVVGMADLKLALLVNAVSPAVGGVLLRGEKGTAKSTVVRGLASLLPPVENLRLVSTAVAVHVARAAERDGLATSTVDDPIRQVHQAMWRPEYPPFDVV